AVTLSWSVSGTTQADISTIGSVEPSGTRSVTPASSTEYVLTATNNAGTTSMKAKVDVTSFGKDKPELVITGFRVEGNKAYFKIKNVGGGHSKPSTAYLFVEGSKRASCLVEPLSGDEERELPFPNYEWSYGSGRTFRLPVRVCADALDQVLEYDENNNCLSMDW
ncbi:MAG: hypothetical protein JW901_10280, partial [Dehalococcoidia bacterium]|nr:hypothetical protein [Dehalococcoidia bacterium]